MINNQRGVTLVELLVILMIMGAITAVVTGLVTYSLQAEQSVSSKNEVQREARFIMEFMTEKMRDGVKWQESEAGKLELKHKDDVFMTYLKESSTITLGNENGSVLSNSATLNVVKNEDDSQHKVILIVSNSIRLETTILYERSNLRGRDE